MPEARVAEAGAAGAGPATARSGQRRRLWQLPAQAHELLLAMSFTPEALRREAARTLGQIHKGQCVLQGRDVDVLYGVVHDMATRNALSEAMHKQLDGRHALAVRQLAAIKDVQALQAAWAQALAADAVPAALWAALTHPLGTQTESDLLYDARQWIFAHARRSVALQQARQQTDARAGQAQQRADQLQARLVAQQQQAAEALGRAQAEIARLQGELARRRAAPADAAPKAADPHRALHRPDSPSTAAPAEAAVRTPACAMAAARPATPAASAATSAAQAPAPARREAVAVSGRRVLCVGGIRHSVARYRGRIEKLGGRFEHHDGGLEDGVHVLDARLSRADVVICQAACINHEAYHRVKRHCERTGTPCVYLDRPSLSRLDRALAPAQAGHDELG